MYVSTPILPLVTTDTIKSKVWVLPVTCFKGQQSSQHPFNTQAPAPPSCCGSWGAQVDAQAAAVVLMAGGPLRSAHSLYTQGWQEETLTFHLPHLSQWSLLRGQATPLYSLFLCHTGGGALVYLMIGPIRSCTAFCCKKETNTFHLANSSACCAV